MSIFNQIVPNLVRPFTGGDQNNGKSSAGSEFTLQPSYEIKETPEAWNLTVQLPGVSRESLEFSAEENLITLTGRRAWQQPEGWTSLYRDSVDAPYRLVLEHSNNVEVGKIQAELKDGVLQVSLPKTEAVKPRKISVN
jgi:HSP20 family molecular chaperone IbpA